MLKLKHYLKPYLGLMLAAVALLFGQAMLELTLPNMMSDIVNVGIQQGGITQAAPEALSAQAMEMMTPFFSQQDAQAVSEGYQTLSQAQEEGLVDGERLRESYPNLADEDYVRVASDEELTALEGAFSRGDYALMQVVEALAAQTGAAPTAQSQSSEQAEDTAQQTTLDLDRLAGALSMALAQSSDLVENAVQTAAVTPDMMLEQTAAVFTKSFYAQLGADTGAIQTHYILMKGLEMLGLAVLLTVFAVSAGFCLARMGAGVGRDLRHAVFTRVTHFNHAELDQFSTASLITRSTNDVQQIQMFLSVALGMMIFAPVMGVGGLIMGLTKCLNMAWILAMALVIMLGVILMLFVVALPRFKRMQKLVDRLNLVAREELSGIMVVRAFANQDFMQNRFEKANKDLTSNTLFVNRSMAVMAPVMTLVMNGVSLLIVWVGGHQIAQSNMQVGDMMAFIQYAMHVIMSFLFISIMFIMVPRASVSAERISEVLATKNAVADPEHPQHLPSPVRGVVRFEDVSFRYEGASEDVLSHVSFTAQPGQTTAFIGSTGSGKSTLVNLVPRFYDVTSGRVTVDGVDVRDLTQHELRQAIGYVPQKGMLFSGTIASNLRYGDESADDATLAQAADIAQATEFISRLPEGFDTEISQGGTNVSGGQRQRLSIARALVKKAPIYIFDDTFSALDFKTDAKLRAALAGCTQNATVLIVAQRVSTIMHAQQIVVLDEGRVVGIGTHQQLLENCETYREIAQSQLSKEELA